MKKAISITGEFCFLVLSLLAQKENSFPVQAEIENGIIEGLYDTKTGLQVYFGIPFASPPVGDLRWKAPLPVKSWDGVLDTKSCGCQR